MNEQKEEWIKAKNTYSAAGLSHLINNVFTNASIHCCYCTHCNGECVKFARAGTCRTVNAIGYIIQDIFELVIFGNHWLVLREDLKNALIGLKDQTVDELMEEYAADPEPRTLLKLIRQPAFRYLWYWWDSHDRDSLPIFFGEIPEQGYMKLEIKRNGLSVPVE